MTKQHNFCIAHNVSSGLISSVVVNIAFFYSGQYSLTELLWQEPFDQKDALNSRQFKDGIAKKIHHLYCQVTQIAGLQHLYCTVTGEAHRTIKTFMTSAEVLPRETRCLVTAIRTDD